MASSAKWWTFGDAKGLSQRGHPLLSGDAGALVESENLSFFQAGGFVQRFGSPALTLTGFGFTGMVEWMGRSITTGGTEELWAAANNAGTAVLGRRVGGVRTSVTFSDTVNVANLRYMQSASLGSKFFINYDSDVNRLHVWDGTTLRRVGFAQSPAPSVMPMGGTGITGTHFYRQRYIEVRGTTIIRRSEPSTSVTLGISNKQGWQVIKGAALNEGETHWEIEAADADEGPWFRIATIDVSTTTYEDTTGTIDDTNLSPLIGEYIPPPSAKFILADTNRIVLAGAWEGAGADDETAPRQNRVWFTPRLGATDEGDDERIPVSEDSENFTDVGNEGPITAMAGPLYGDIYVFKADSIFKLTPTGDLITPYRVIQVSAGIGAVDQRVVCVGSLGTGTPAIFFASSSSVYVITSGGVQEISDDVSRDLRATNFTAQSSWLAFDPYDKGLKVQTNAGMSPTTGQYYQFTYALKEQRWSGMSFGGAEAVWVLGRSQLGINTILGGGGTEVRCTVVAQNDNGSTRLLMGGQDDSEASQILACGDVCGVDGTTPFTSTFRVRKFPTPGHRFTVGAPTVIYRNPVGTSGVRATLTVSLLDQHQNAVSDDFALSPTDQDDPIDQQVLTCDGIQHGDLTVLDLRMTLTHSGPFETAIPPSLDAVMIAIAEKESYAQ